MQHAGYCYFYCEENICLAPICTAVDSRRPMVEMMANGKKQ